MFEAEPFYGKLCLVKNKLVLPPSPKPNRKVELLVDEVEDSPLADHVRNYEKTWKLRQIFPRLTFLKLMEFFKLSYT